MCSLVTVTVEHTDSGGGILSGGIISSNSLGHNSWLKQFSSKFHAVRRRSLQRVVLKSCGLIILPYISTDFKQFSILGSSCGRSSQCVAVEPGEPGPRKLGDPGRRGSRIWIVSRTRSVSRTSCAETTTRQQGWQGISSSSSARVVRVVSSSAISRESTPSPNDSCERERRTPGAPSRRQLGVFGFDDADLPGFSCERVTAELVEIQTLCNWASLVRTIVLNC